MIGMDRLLGGIMDSGTVTRMMQFPHTFFNSFVPALLFSSKKTFGDARTRTHDLQLPKLVCYRYATLALMYLHNLVILIRTKDLQSVFTSKKMIPKVKTECTIRGRFLVKTHNTQIINRGAPHKL